MDNFKKFILCYSISFLFIVCSIVLIFLSYNIYSIIVTIVTGIIFFIIPLLYMRLRKISWGDKTLELNKNTDQIASKIAEKLKSTKEDGTIFKDSEKAFIDAKKLIADLIEENTSSSIRLRFITIALKYSNLFIEKDVYELARKYPLVNFEIETVTIHPDFISRFDFSDENEDWRKIAEFAKDKLEENKKKFLSSRLTNVNISHNYYEGFPQFHGLLINSNYLFLGRTDWKIPNNLKGKLKLTVSSNDYRYYCSTDIHGNSRIENFRHWFSFYSRYFEIADKVKDQDIDK